LGGNKEGRRERVKGRNDGRGRREEGRHSEGKRNKRREELLLSISDKICLFPIPFSTVSFLFFLSFFRFYGLQCTRICLHLFRNVIGIAVGM
jgi:hypothetical protein